MTEIFQKPSNVRQLRKIDDLQRRWKTSWPAALRSARGYIPCNIKNISRGGAQLIVEYVIETDTVSLLIATFDPINARVVWRRRDRVGVQFAPVPLWIVDLMKKAAMTNSSARAN